MIERQPILFQRVEDVEYGIWWINSQKNYIKKIKIRDPGATQFYFFLVKEIVFSHRARSRFREQERYDPDGLEELNFQLIDEIFNKTIARLGIELSLDETIAKKIRECVQHKDRFTIAELSEELVLDPLAIHKFIYNSNDIIPDNFKIIKEQINNKGPYINIYIRK